MHDIDRIQNRELESFEFEGEGEGEAFEFQAEAPSVFSENELNELAAELLSVSNEGELNYFLGGLIKKAAGAIGKAIKSPVGQQLGSLLKGVAKQALPIAGSALGNLIAPGVGGAIGGKLGSFAGKALGLELEGLSQEDREWEVAKQFVRLAGDATKGAMASPLAPGEAARQAVAQATARFAPGLAAAPSGSYMPAGVGGGHSGRWIRRGRKIVLLGV